MELNCILFPAPSPPTYICQKDIGGDGKLIFIPMRCDEEGKEENKKELSPASNTFIRSYKQSDKSFPCYYIPYIEDNEG